MSSQSSPIDITNPQRRYGSDSPRNKTSTLTSALQQAGPGSSPLPNSYSRLSKMDTKSTAARKDSLAVPVGSSTSGTKPISVGGKPRRESNTGSFMGGASWGGMSFGSFLQDDSLMGGLSPNVNSSSFHSSSYLPKMEANFWNNLKCCDTIFGNLHELVQHFETVHKQAPSHLPYSNLPRRKSSSTNPADWNAHGNVRGVQPWAESRLSGMPTSRWAGAYQDTGRKQSTIGMQDMDTIGEMELDDDHTMPGQGFEGFDQQTDGYSSNTTPSIGHAMSDGSLKGDTGSPEHYQGQPSHATYSNNMYSSMSQQLNSHQQQQQMPQMSQMQGYGHMNERLQANGGFQAQHNANAVPFNTQMFDRLSSNFKSMDVGSNNDMRDLCINEPAKNLYADDGTFNSQQYPHFNFGGSMTNGGGEITHNNDENAKKLQAQRLAAGIGKQPTEEERPFKCPVIGCEKAYKNANGLRYHEKHGHSNQKLKDNGDGTFSIVDPVTSIPYPGTVGMEKEKPYRCEVCGKRYKNLNGLKYHRNHSPPCNPDFQMSQIPNLQGDMDGEAVY